MNEIEIPKYTKRDYLSSTAPYEWIYQFKDDKLKMKQMLTLMSEAAGEQKVRNFVTLFNLYLQDINSRNGIIINNTTDFEGQEMELNCGSWYADDMGVIGTDKYGFEKYACNHPIMPVQRLVNIDTGIEKLKLAYKKNKQWRSTIADKRTLASGNSILQLADYGIAVNSENSKYLVQYLTDVEHLNYDRIQEVNSVGRLGWIDDYGFSPYVDELVFDGDISYKHFFESVKQKGSFEEWKELVSEIRRGDVCGRFILAAGFSSVLVKICGALPFFVHLWGGTETGKTVALMLAASIWANPKLGNYIHTFNSTAVAQELSAGFVNSLPLIIDELQILKDRKDFDNIIYTLCEGVGRSRGQKTGGLQKLATWQNCIITSGEMPINCNNSGGGAINRIIEIDCQDMKIFTDPIRVSKVIKSNYGHAGKEFVNKLMSEIDYAVAIHQDFYKNLSAGETTEKQSLAASLILTADKLIEEWIFKDGITLSVEDITPFLSTKHDVSINERALQYLYDFVAINQNKFTTNNFGEYTGEIWGCEDKEYIYIIKAQFDKIMHGEGYNPTAFLSWAKRNNLINSDEKKHTKLKRVYGGVTRCVHLKKETETLEPVDFDMLDDLLN